MTRLETEFFERLPRNLDSIAKSLEALVALEEKRISLMEQYIENTTNKDFESDKAEDYDLVLD